MSEMATMSAFKCARLAQHPLEAAAAANDACPGLCDSLWCVGLGWHAFSWEEAGAASCNSAVVMVTYRD